MKKSVCLLFVFCLFVICACENSDLSAHKQQANHLKSTALKALDGKKQEGKKNLDVRLKHSKTEDLIN